jgi:hypothetical protein
MADSFDEETQPFLPTKAEQLQLDLETQHEKLIELQENIVRFDTLFREHPHTIRITGIYFLKDHVWTRTLQDKVYNLFHEAKIPLFWIHDINFNIDSWDPAIEEPVEESAQPVTVDSIDVSTPVYVTLTNYYVKERVIHLLNSYFDTEYNQLLKVT